MRLVAGQSSGVQQCVGKPCLLATLPACLPCCPRAALCCQTCMHRYVAEPCLLAMLSPCSIIRESAWQLELKGDVTRQRRLEAVDKLMSVLTLVRAGLCGLVHVQQSDAWTGRGAQAGVSVPASLAGPGCCSRGIAHALFMLPVCAASVTNPVLETPGVLCRWWQQCLACRRWAWMSTQVGDKFVLQPRVLVQAVQRSCCMWLRKWHGWRAPAPAFLRISSPPAAHSCRTAALLTTVPYPPPRRLPTVLAIGGVGGLAVGLAGREILENLFTGLIILSSNPFEVRCCSFFR